MKTAEEWANKIAQDRMLRQGSTVATIREIQAEARRETLEEAARLHESIAPYCDHEPSIGAGAMGAVIRYRDAIRMLAPPAAATEEGE